jgi:hypothetical protein
MPHCAADGCARQHRWWQGPVKGVTLDGLWVCSRACVERIARARLCPSPPRPVAVPSSGRPSLRLGALLRHQRACPPGQIDEALAAQADSHLRLGEQLRAMGALQAPAVLRALAAQAGVSYLATVDVERLPDTPEGISIEAVRALGVLPLGPPAGDRVRVAFPAPVPREALTAFRLQTGWTPDPFLVGDDEWQVLLQRYSRLPRSGAGDFDTAVQRLADAVMATGEAQLRDTRWGPNVWVRVLGGDRPVDVVYVQSAEAIAAKEESWQAATTSR